MLAEDQTITRKEAARTKAVGERWNLYDEIWRSPIHGPTPHAPSLEAKPSKAGLILGLAKTAIGGAVTGAAFKAPDIGNKSLSFGEGMKVDLDLGTDLSTFDLSGGAFS